jgi:hypothetical protein
MGDFIMRSRIAAAVLAASVAVACSSNSVRPPTQPESITLPLVSEKGAGGSDQNHTTHLSGDQEVFSAAPGAPTPADSNAQGQAIFKIDRDDQSFDYKLIASNIENITQAHIHCGLVSLNGPIVVWLYPNPTSTAALPGGAGRHDGVLAEGTVESGVALHVRPAPSSAACPGGIATFADVLARMRAGDAYVNVHTNDGIGLTNTGPGDFPGGEVRGQFK